MHNRMTCAAHFACGSHHLRLHLCYCAAAGTIFGTTDVYELGFSYLSISIFSRGYDIWKGIDFINCNFFKAFFSSTPSRWDRGRRRRALWDLEATTTTTSTANNFQRFDSFFWISESYVLHSVLVVPASTANNFQRFDSSSSQLEKTVKRNAEVALWRLLLLLRGHDPTSLPIIKMVVNTVWGHPYTTWLDFRKFLPPSPIVVKHGHLANPL